MVSLHTPPKMNRSILASLSNPKPTRCVKIRHFSLGLLAVLIVASMFWIIYNLNTIRDWYLLATYHPPQIVSQLASVDGMTNYAKDLFYLNRPAIEGKSAFAANCSNKDNQTHVIGCYHDGDNGIFLLNVTDPQLNGIIPVTAAYEMLHAGYARLSKTEQTSIDNQMWQFYQGHNLGTEIKAQMASYAVTEPGAKYDELYSVLGTEVAALPAQLENHYKLYFKNRASIVRTYQNYQAAFNSRENSIAAYNKELTTLLSQINASKNQLTVLQNSITQQQNTLNQYQASGNFSAYNINVLGYNALINQYNDLVYATRSEVSQYNIIVGESNALALEERQLVQAISSTPSIQSPK